MNDFERKLSQQAFRAPPPDWREAIFSHGEVPAKAGAVERWTWRDWFWPSPLAWGALAALWILFAVFGTGGGDTPAAPETALTAQLAASPTLLSYHATRDLNDVLPFTH